MKQLDISQDNKTLYRLTDPGTVIYYLKNRCGDITFSIEHPRAEARIFCIFEGNGKEKLSLKTTQNHIAPDGKSYLLVKSVLRGSSHLAYSGNIRIAKEGSGVEASLENRNLLLGSRASVDTQPNLEILANDVRCSHAVTTASLDPEQLSYLRTRGLAEPQAEKLLIKGFLRDVQERIQLLKKDN